MTDQARLGAYVMPTYSHTIAVLNAAREGNGLSQNELGRRVGWAPATVSNALTGAHEVRASRLFALAHALGYDLALIPRRPEPCDHPQGTGTICDVCGGDVAALALIPREDTP